MALLQKGSGPLFSNEGSYFYMPETVMAGILAIPEKASSFFLFLLHLKLLCIFLIAPFSSATTRPLVPNSLLLGERF